MTVFAFIFYLFAVSMLICAFMTVISRKPMQCLLWLMAAVSSSAGLLVTLGAVAFAVLLVIFAFILAVFFVAALRKIELNAAAPKLAVTEYVLLSLFIAAVMFSQLALGVGTWHFAEGYDGNLAAAAGDADRAFAVGGALLEHTLILQGIALVWLIGIIGAITLIVRKPSDETEADVSPQILRNRTGAIELRDIRSGQGW